MSKWYNNLREKDIVHLKRTSARIGYPDFGINENNCLSLQFKLHYGGNKIDKFELENSQDILNLLKRAGCNYISELAGKTVEVWSDGEVPKGISIDSFLIQ